jgi:hypothetical protein
LEDIVCLKGYESSSYYMFIINKWVFFLVGFLARYLFGVVNKALCFELSRVSSRGLVARELTFD